MTKQGSAQESPE